MQKWEIEVERKKKKRVDKVKRRAARVKGNDLKERRS